MRTPPRRAVPRRLVPGGQGVTLRALPAVLLLAAVLVLTGCPSGYVQTSTGATVAASTVHAQDLVGDALQALQDVHNAAVRAHDAKAGAEPADVHAKRREALKASAAGLRAGWSGLEAWKLGTAGAGMVAVVTPIREALPELLRAAVALGIVSKDYADAIGVFFGTAATGKTPEPLAKEPVQRSAISEPAEEGYALVQGPAYSARIGVAPGVCTAEDLARGLCVGGCTASIPPICSSWRITDSPLALGGQATLESPRGTTLEWRPR